LRRREVKRSYEFSNYSEQSSSRAVTRSHSGARRAGSTWRRVWKLSPYILVSLAIVYIVFFSSLFQVGKFDVQGPNNILSQNLEKEVKNYLNSRLLAKNWLFLNDKDLKSYLQKTFTGQEAISVIKKFPNGLVVSTDEQKPGLLWKTGSRNYILSTSGRVMFEQNKPDGQPLPQVVDSTNLPVEIGSRVAGRDFVDYVRKVSDFATSNKIVIERIYVLDTTSELYVRTQSGYDIKFSTLQNPDTATRALKATLELLAQQNKKPSSYIDLRVEGRAFYK
jgi:cell division septal protein FtsQ